MAYSFDVWHTPEPEPAELTEEEAKEQERRVKIENTCLAVYFTLATSWAITTAILMYYGAYS